MRLLRPLTSLRVLAPALLALIGACSDGVTAPDPLAAPATVTATTQGSTAVQLSWAPVSGAERYEVDRATVTGTFATVATVTTTTFRDSTLVAETSYKFRVRALRGAEQGPYSTGPPRSPGTARSFRSRRTSRPTPPGRTPTSIS